MTWGDVLAAAIAACSSVGTEARVNPERLAEAIEEINSVCGDARSIYATGPEREP